MTLVTRNGVLFCIAGLLVASAALAQVDIPDPSRSNLGNRRVTFGGSTTPGGTTSDACTGGRCGDLMVTIRDFANNVIPGASVVIDFSACTDINISCAQLGASTGQVYFASHKVGGVTDNNGRFTFRLQGGGPTNTGTCGATNCAGTRAGDPCAVVYADGVPLGSLPVAAYDIDRAGSPDNAVSSVDVAKVTQEWLNVLLVRDQARARDDYDFNGMLTANDAALEAQFALDRGLGTGSSDTQHTGWSTWPSAGTPAGFCP
jgi:hypothetical protein